MKKFRLISSFELGISSRSGLLPLRVDAPGRTSGCLNSEAGSSAPVLFIVLYTSLFLSV